jgi:hypothetical protein
MKARKPGHTTLTRAEHTLLPGDGYVSEWFNPVTLERPRGTPKCCMNEEEYGPQQSVRDLSKKNFSEGTSTLNI